MATPNANQRESRVPAKTTTTSYNPLSGMVATPAKAATPAQAATPSTFTYGLGNPLETRVTQPGQTLPTTTPKIVTPTATPKATPTPTPTPEPIVGGGGVVIPDENKFPVNGTFAGWEYSADKKQRRMKFNDGNGGFYYGDFETVAAPVEDKSLTERTLASDTFKNTFALIFGQTEANQAYVTKLFDLVSGFYKSGSDIQESINLALRAARQQNAIPEFTSRFEGIFELEKLQQAGMAIEVPDIASYIKAEQSMGDLMREAGLGDIANQKFIGQIIGKGKSVLEVGNLISDVFNAIDYAPAALKQDLQTYFPGVDRASIATAILTGPEGATKLKNKIQSVSVMSAARQQGVAGIGLEQGQNIANMGFSYQDALTGFGTVKNLERANTLAQFSNLEFTSQQAQKAVFDKSEKELNEIERLKQLEIGRYKGSSGRFASKDRTAGLI
jgi:hypothetical protein